MFPHFQVRAFSGPAFLTPPSPGSPAPQPTTGIQRRGMARSLCAASRVERHRDISCPSRSQVIKFCDPFKAGCTVYLRDGCGPINPLHSKGNYSTTSNNTKLEYIGRWWVGCYLWYSEEGPPRCTKCNSPPINGQCTNHYCYMMVRCCAVLIWILKG